MKKTGVALLTLGLTSVALADLQVRETAAGFSVFQDGKIVLKDMRLTYAQPNAVHAERSTASDGSTVWNSWCEEEASKFRFEAVQRSDGNVEFTYLTTVDDRAKPKCRGLVFELPAAVFGGKRYDALLGRGNDFVRGTGAFAKDATAFFTRYLASEGIVFNFDPLGPANCGNVKGRIGLAGAWEVVPQPDGGASVRGVMDFNAPFGGFGGVKLVLHEGSIADYSRDHFLADFAYEQPLPVGRLVRFGSPHAGPDYADGDFAWDRERACGWLDGAKHGIQVGHRSGAYYSHAVGQGRAVYRFSGLPNGYYVATVQIGNWTGERNRFSVSAVGERLGENIEVGPRKARTLARMVHVAGGNADFTFEGDWLVSAIGLQPRMSDAEDFSVTRALWYADGYEPTVLYHNADYKTPMKPATLDETIDMPVPGQETATAYREPPRPVELPESQSMDWTYHMKMWRLFSNGCTLHELADDDFRERYFSEMVAKNRYNVVMVNGMLSRHTFTPRMIKSGQRMVAKYAETAHRHGMKYLDHIDITLLWAREFGFRAMAERLPEILRNTSNNLPAFQLCYNNPELKRKLFAYLREQAQAGVDGFQLDEVLFYYHGCTCKYCRERFAAETGWQLPLDETDPSLCFESGSALARRWKDWQTVTASNWFVEIRRMLRDIRPDLFLSSYSTLRNQTLRYTKASPKYIYKCQGDLTEYGRVMNMFGNEVMTENTLQGARPVLPLMRLKNIVNIAFGAPVWDWFHDRNLECSFFSWGLANLCGQIPFLTPNLPPDPKVPDPDAWSASSRALNAKGYAPIAEVAVVFSSPSLLYSPREDYANEMLGLAQELERLHVPYEFLGNHSLEENRLKKYKIVFLGDASCMSAKELSALEDFRRNGGRVYGRPGAGAFDEVGQPRLNPPTFAEMPSAAAFCAEELITWQSLVWKFDPKVEDEAAFSRWLAEAVRGATWWRIENLPDRVYTAVGREAGGDIVLQFLNGTGANLKAGETMSFDAPAVPYPPLPEDVVLTVPVCASATAYSPDWGSAGRPLTVRPTANGMTVVLPGEMLHRYVLIRLSPAAAPLINTSPADATAIVQSALDGGGEVVLSRAGSPWNVGPLFLRSNTHLVLEPGAELVAKTNAFFHVWDRLLSVEHVENVTISGGAGSTIRMRREDYLKPPYGPSEHRHAIGVYDSTNVVVEGLLVTDSGGDGLCAGRKTKGLFVRDCDMNRNHRQGISICTGENILIERCKLRNTKGTAPQAGIDYEPNEASDCIANCVLRDCEIENNRGQAIEVNLSRLRTKSRPVSLTVENCRTFGGATSFRVRCGDRADDFVTGFIRFRNCTFTAPRDRVFWLGDCPGNDFTVAFENCTVTDVPQGPRRLAWFESGVLDQTPPDGFDFGKLTVKGPVEAPWFWHRNPGIGPSASHLAGELAFENLDGKAETVKLDAAWSAVNLAPVNGGRPLPKRLSLGDRPPTFGDRPQGLCSNTNDLMKKCSNIVFGGRAKGIPLVFYSPKSGVVRLKIRRLDSKKPVPRKPFTMCWLDRNGKGHGGKSYLVDPKGVQEIVYNLPKRGYCLLETPWRGGRYVLESSTVETAFDVRKGALKLAAERGQTLELGFDRVPGEAVLFVEPVGTDPATVEILNDMGRCVLAQSVAGRTLLPLPEGKGRWSVRLAAQTGKPSAFFDLYGTVPLFYIPSFNFHF